MLFLILPSCERWDITITQEGGVIGSIRFVTHKQPRIYHRLHKSPSKVRRENFTTVILNTGHTCHAWHVTLKNRYLSRQNLYGRNIIII